MVHSGTGMIVMVMMGHIGPLGDDGCRHGQSGGMVVLVPLADTLHDCKDEDPQNQHKDDGEHDSENREAGSKSGKSKIIKAQAIAHTHFSFLSVAVATRTSIPKAFA